ncbi:MAG: hypothetical protein WLagBPW_16380 [Shewanella algae]
MKPTEADSPELIAALTVPAPAMLDVASEITALPSASVRAVPMAGLKVPRFSLLRVKVTSCPANAPVKLLLTVAVKVAGFSAEILGSEIFRVTVVVPVGGVEPSPVSEILPPPPQANKRKLHNKVKQNLNADLIVRLPVTQ